MFFDAYNSEELVFYDSEWLYSYFSEKNAKRKKSTYKNLDLVTLLKPNHILKYRGES